MGQYYRACTKKESSKTWGAMISYDYGNGAKLMEHSYIRNPYVSAVMDKLFRNPLQLVWAGDYADKEDEHKKNIFRICRKLKPRVTQKHSNEEFKYIINHTKRVFVDISNVQPNEYGYRINPLPILTADGNGRGGGDYSGTNMELVGSWARDVISVDTIKPVSANSNEFKEIEITFDED